MLYYFFHPLTDIKFDYEKIVRVLSQTAIILTSES